MTTTPGPVHCYIIQWS